MTFLARAFGLLAALALLFLAVGLWNATRPPVIVRQTIELAGLPEGSRLTVLLLSDVHFGHPDMNTPRLLGIMAQAQALKPDLVLMAGDYMGGKLLDWPRVWLEQALPPLGAIDAPLGVFAVLGNHDEPTWVPKVIGRQHRPTLLVNSHVEAGPVVVAGLNSAKHGADLAGTLARLPRAKPLLLLMHEGDMTLWAKPPPRPVLALAGHTHGGQVVLPLIGSVGARLLGPPVCNRGLCNVNGWPLFVTSGVGTSWLPIRYGMPSEIVILTLVPPPLAGAAARSTGGRAPPAYSTGRKSGTER